MKKIFVNPSVKEIELLGESICAISNELGKTPVEGGTDNDFAPVRLDIFNYGGLQ